MFTKPQGNLHISKLWKWFVKLIQSCIKVSQNLSSLLKKKKKKSGKFWKDQKCSRVWNNQMKVEINQNETEGTVT